MEREGQRERTQLARPLLISPAHLHTRALPLDMTPPPPQKYLTLIYQDMLSDEAKAAYWATHIDAATATKARNGGAVRRRGRGGEGGRACCSRLQPSL